MDKNWSKIAKSLSLSSYPNMNKVIGMNDNEFKYFMENTKDFKRLYYTNAIFHSIINYIRKDNIDLKKLVDLFITIYK